MKKINLSIIIVNYKSRIRLENLLTSIVKSKPKVSYEIIVVNNSPEEKLEKKISNINEAPHNLTVGVSSPSASSGAEFLRSKTSSQTLASLRSGYFAKGDKHISVINNLINNGYGAGNNLGARNAKGRYFLFLNPDTEVKENSIDILFNFLQKNKEVGMVAPNLLDKKGNVLLQLGSRRLTPLRAVIALSIINKIFPINPISKTFFMKDKSVDTLREAHAIPGSAFMIRSDVFRGVGGFDEMFFMYFEESDLGRKVEEAGYKIFINPESEIVHNQKKQNNNENLREYYNDSRFYYFKKYYGNIAALTVDLFCRISKYEVLFFLFFLFGVYLRVYNMNSLFFLDSEIADNLLDIKNYYFTKTIPLIGPPTSHPWLYFGPLFYWIYGPVLILMKFNPFSHLYFGIFVNILVIPVNYFFVQKYWNKKTALLSTVFISLSPYLLGFSFTSRFYTYTVLLSYLVIYFLFEYLKGRRSIFWLSFSIGIVLNFHYSAIVLIPCAIVVSLFNGIKLKRNDLIRAISGILIPLSPLFVYDLSYGFVMTKKLILWFPYRILSVIGLLPRNEISQNYLVGGVRNMFSFLGQLLSGTDMTVVFYIAAFTVFYLLYKSLSYFNKLDSNTKNLFVVIVISVFLLAIHGNTPNHYFLVVSTYVLILMSSVIVNISERIEALILISLILLILTLNSFNYISSIYQKEKLMKSEKLSFMLFSEQNKITRFIADDSKNSPFSLKRIGDNDQFSGNFAQNYQYLLWMKGNEPVIVGDEVIKNIKPGIEYTIIENADYDLLNLKYREIFKTNDVIILKKNL